MWVRLCRVCNHLAEPFLFVPRALALRPEFQPIFGGFSADLRHVLPRPASRTHEVGFSLLCSEFELPYKQGGGRGVYGSGLSELEI